MKQLASALMAVLMLVAAIGSLIACIAALFTDVDPPSAAFLWALAAMVFAHAGNDYIDKVVK